MSSSPSMTLFMGRESEKRGLPCPTCISRYKRSAWKSCESMMTGTVGISSRITHPHYHTEQTQHEMKRGAYDLLHEIAITNHHVRRGGMEDGAKRVRVVDLALRVSRHSHTRRSTRCRLEPNRPARAEDDVLKRAEEKKSISQPEH